MLTDPIADMLTRIRNAQMAKKSFTSIPYSKIKAELLKVLREKNFILGVEEGGSGINKELIIKLTDRIFNLKRVSKPGRRVYKGKDELKPVVSGYGIAILSTSAGIMSADEAKKKGVGGEILCEIW